MKYDKPLIASAIGAASTITGEVVTRALTLLGVGEYSIYQLISLVITFNRPTVIIGFIVNCIAGTKKGMQNKRIPSSNFSMPL